MKQLSQTLFSMNSVEKSKILDEIKRVDSQSYRFYKSLFKYKRIPIFFIDDILQTVGDKLPKNILNNLKIINSNIEHNQLITDLDPCFNKLQKFQQNALDKLNNLAKISGYYKGLLISDEPGLGKTATSICLTKSYLKSQDIDISEANIVVVVPLTLINDWIASMKTAFPNASVTSNINIEADIYVVNYEKLKKMNEIPSVVIVDEAHNFHHITSNRYIELFNFVQQAQLVLLITGTPVRDSITNLLALQGLIDYRLSNYGLLVKLVELLQNFYKYIYKVLIKKFSVFMTRARKNEISDNVGELDMRPLPINIDDFQFRKRKLALNQISEQMTDMINVISDFNEKAKNDEIYAKIKEIVQTYVYDIDPEEIYKMILKMKIKSIDINLVKKYINIITYQTKQAYNSKLWHSLLDDTLIFIIENHIDQIIKFINQYGKVLIVSKSRKAVDYLHTLLKSKYNLQGVNITANMSAKERFENIKYFETSSKNKYLISTYPIIEAGVNLPFAKAILLLDMPFRPHSLEQVINRTQRLNNLSDKIIVRYLKLSYKYNILEHHYLLLNEISIKVKKILNIIQKEL